MSWGAPHDGKKEPASGECGAAQKHLFCVCVQQVLLVRLSHSSYTAALLLLLLQVAFPH